MSCMCGATDCPSCGRAQGYTVKFSPGRGHYNPVMCEQCHEEEVKEEGDLCEVCTEAKCPKCGSFDTDIGLHHEASALAPECWYNACNECDHQWGHS